MLCQEIEYRYLIDLLWYCSYFTRIYARNYNFVPLLEKLEESVYPRLSKLCSLHFWTVRCVPYKIRYSKYCRIFTVIVDNGTPYVSIHDSLFGIHS
jgi:hypothetical protein